MRHTLRGASLLAAVRCTIVAHSAPTNWSARMPTRLASVCGACPTGRLQRWRGRATGIGHMPMRPHCQYNAHSRCVTRGSTTPHDGAASSTKAHPWHTKDSAHHINEQATCPRSKAMRTAAQHLHQCCVAHGGASDTGRGRASQANHRRIATHQHATPNDTSCVRAGAAAGCGGWGTLAAHWTGGAVGARVIDTSVRPLRVGGMLSYPQLGHARVGGQWGGELACVGVAWRAAHVPVARRA